MKVIISAAMSLDGCLDDNSPERLKLSSVEDWEQVKLLRVECDAILVGAETVRRDNPSLVIDDKNHQQQRINNGLSEDIAKVTITKSGNLNPNCKFFQQGNGEKIVFVESGANVEALDKIKPYARIVMADKITASLIETKLEEMGYNSLMVEGGGGVLTMFFEEGVMDEFRLAVAPLFVGDTSAPRLIKGGELMWNKNNRMQLDRVEKLGDTAVMHYKNRRK